MELEKQHVEGYHNRIAYFGRVLSGGGGDKIDGPPDDTPPPPRLVGVYEHGDFVLHRRDDNNDNNDNHCYDAWCLGTCRPLPYACLCVSCSSYSMGTMDRAVHRGGGGRRRVFTKRSILFLRVPVVGMAAAREGGRVVAIVKIITSSYTCCRERSVRRHTRCCVGATSQNKQTNKPNLHVNLSPPPPEPQTRHVYDIPSRYPAYASLNLHPPPKVSSQVVSSS